MVPGTSRSGITITAALFRDFDILLAPVRRISGLDVPMPYSRKIEKLCIPQTEGIVQGVRDLMKESY